VEHVDSSNRVAKDIDATDGGVASICHYLGVVSPIEFGADVDPKILDGFFGNVYVLRAMDRVDVFYPQYRLADQVQVGASVGVKVMNLHFSGSVVKLFLYSHWSTCVYLSVTESVAPLMVDDVAYMAPLLMYMVRSLRAHVLVISSRLAVYIADSIGDKGEPCGVPLVIAKESEVCPLPLSVAVLTDRKDSTQVHMPGGKPLSQNICTV